MYNLTSKYTHILIKLINKAKFKNYKTIECFYKIKQYKYRVAAGFRDIFSRFCEFFPGF